MKLCAVIVIADTYALVVSKFVGIVIQPIVLTFSLVSGVLYPAYASFKAVKTRNMRAYVSFYVDSMFLVVDMLLCSVCYTIIYYVLCIETT